MTFTVQLLDDTVEPVDSHHAAGLYLLLADPKRRTAGRRP